MKMPIELCRPHVPVILLATALLVAGCGADGTADRDRGADGRLRVVATTSLIADLARVIGGDAVQVTGLMGPGVDPHLYKASEGDVHRMQKADLIFFNGLHLEGAMGEVLERLAARRPVVAVTEGLPDSLLHLPPEFAGNPDPHIWFDVSLWARAAGVVAEALIRHDSTRAEVYRRQWAAYRDTLADLDRSVRTQVARVPDSLRILVTAHDAFNYFGRAYGFDVRGLQGISTVSEAGTADVQELAEFIVSRRIPAIFVESSVSPRSIQAVQAAVGARGFSVAIGGQLFSDALGDAHTGADTYPGMVRHNVSTIVSSLIGDQP